MRRSEELFMRSLRRGSIGGPVGVYTADFSVDADPIDPTRWQGGLLDGLDWNNMKTVSGRAHAAGFSSLSPPPFNDSVALLKSSEFACTPNQSVEITYYKQVGYITSDTHETGLFARAAMSGHSITGYEWYIGFAASSTLILWGGPLNTFTALFAPSPSAPSDGDRFRLEVIGQSIRCYQNDVLVGSGTDATYSSGQVGMQSYVVNNGGGSLT